MKVTVLGCGGAGGVPLIGNVWGACDPFHPKNRRTRVSILVEEGRQSLLVDTSPDMREQLLAADVKKVDAILYTHNHADHTHGIDNIRSLNWLMGKSIPVYAEPETLTELRHRFAYIFDVPPTSNRFFKPGVEPHELNGDLQFETINVRHFRQQHGQSFSTGYRFNDFGYSTDASALDDKAFEILSGVKVWVVGAIRERPHPTHANIDTALEWIDKIKPERAFLTHMDHSLDYSALKARLPKNVEPAYDGLEIEC